jgi:hypothetical protein
MAGKPKYDNVRLHLGSLGQGFNCAVLPPLSPPSPLLGEPVVISTDPTLQVAAMNLDEQF